MECGPRTARLARTVVYVALAFASSRHTNAQDAFQLLHSFTFGVDGANPRSALAVNGEGTVIYGTAQDGGSTNHGNVFRLVRTNQGWRGGVLHSFGEGNDGWYPQSALIFDKRGNMYGTTVEGGPYGFGTVFEMSPISGGKWTETVLHGFNLYGENMPMGPVNFDVFGNLYGTTQLGGACWGAIFEMTPPSSPKRDSQSD